jgi:putative salt-induced outer membrane protein YdiY
MNKLILAHALIYSILIFPQVNTEQYRKDSVKIGFTGNLNLEAVAITGNTDFQLLDIGGRLNYNYGDDYTFLVLDAGYGWESGDPFVGQMFAHLRHVITPAQLYQLELFSQYDNNKKRLLLNRELIGGGIRLRLLTADNFKFRIGIAYLFEAEDYDLPAFSIHGNSTNTNRMSSYLTFNYDLQENLSFVSVTYYQPKLNDWNDYKLVSENALVVDSGKLVDLYIKFNVRYDSFPADGIKKTDTVTKMGISFKF